MSFTPVLLLMFSVLFVYIQVIHHMNKDQFFQVWEVYRDHWGKENQVILLKDKARKTLRKRIKSSDKLKSVLFCGTFMPHEILFTTPKELFQSISDFVDACLEEELVYRDVYHEIDATVRLRSRLHCEIKTKCSAVGMRHWYILGRPRVVSYMSSVDASIYRVSAILAL